MGDKKDKNLHKQIGEKIRDERERAGFTLQELSKRV